MCSVLLQMDYWSKSEKEVLLLRWRAEGKTRSGSNNPTGSEHMAVQMVPTLQTQAPLPGSQPLGDCGPSSSEHLRGQWAHTFKPELQPQDEPTHLAPDTWPPNGPEQASRPELHHLRISLQGSLIVLLLKHISYHSCLHVSSDYHLNSNKTQAHYHALVKPYLTYSFRPQG